MKIAVEHLGLLCLNVDATAKILSTLGYHREKTKSFLEEGTKEIYIGSENCEGRLLLMEAISEGPYKLALEKRGPGLHHIAIGVEDLLKFIKKIAYSGWFLHPACLSAVQEKSTAWLVRPMLPLIEVSEKQKNCDKETKLITEIFLPEINFNGKLFSEIGLDVVKKSQDKNSFIMFGSRKFNLKDLATSL